MSLLWSLLPKWVGCPNLLNCFFIVLNDLLGHLKQFEQFLFLCGKLTPQTLASQAKMEFSIFKKKSRKRGYKTLITVKGTGCDKIIILWQNESIMFVRLFYKIWNPKFEQNLVRIEWDIISKINLGTRVNSLDTKV